MLKLSGDLPSQALTLYKAGRLREAESTLLQLREFTPDHWFLLAQIRMAKGLWQHALQALDQIPMRDRAHPSCCVVEGNACKELNRFSDAIEAYNSALASQPDFVPALTNRAALHLLMGNLDLAEADLLNALQLNPGFPDANFHLGAIRLHQGDFATGWLLYESRLQTALCSKLGRCYDLSRRWSGLFEELPNKRLLVYGEQGLGDVVQFSRFLPLLINKGIKVILQIPLPLHRLFVRYWPNLILMDSVAPYEGGFDRYCSLISLPHLLGIKAPPAQPWMITANTLKTYKRTHKPKVGLVWSGLSVRDLERYTPTRRSIGLEALLPILSQDVNFVSLQLNTKPEDRALMAQVGIEDISEQLTDFYETALVLDTLDLLISIDTSVIHLAGALGVPAWVRLPTVSDYRWSGRAQGSAWYPNIRIFRQASPGDWSIPVAEVAQALGQKFGLI